MRRPGGAFGDCPHKIDCAAIGQIAQAVLNWIDAGGRSQLVDKGFVSEGVGQCRYASEPRGPGDCRHVMDRDTHVPKGIRWDAVRSPIGATSATGATLPVKISGRIGARLEG